MPIERYRSAFDQPRPPRAPPSELMARIAAAWERAHLRFSPDPPRGVRRFRSLDEAQAERKQRTRERARRLRQPPPRYLP
jgi:hypothetical protein